MTTIAFATSNEHKVEEVQANLSGTQIRILTSASLGYHGDIAETGHSLEANALIKTRFIHNYLGLPTLSEDTGLEVTALQGAPGIHTARYAGPNRDPVENMDLLLKNLKGTNDRSARFRTVFALIWDHKEYLFEGICEGQIGLVREGTGGFGYDPIFRPSGYDHSFGVLSSAVKNRISHRALGLQKVITFLRDQM